MHETLRNDAPTGIEYRDARDLPRDGVLVLYGACRWSAAEKPDQLMAALAGSHTVISAWHNGRLVGLGNAITDGALVVYYPHLLVHPDFRGRGIGREIMNRLMQNFDGFHQHAILADDAAAAFYRKFGFTRPASAGAMWVYSSTDHGPAEHWGSRAERLFWQVLRWDAHKFRQKLAVALVVVQIVTTLVTAIAFMIETETVVITSFALPLAGFATAVVACLLLSLRTLAFGLSAPLTCAVSALLILQFENYAIGIILALLIAYAIVLIVASRNAALEILSWSPQPRAESAKLRQFSLKTVFAATAGLALYLAAQRLVLQWAGNRGEILYFGTYVLANIALSAAVVAWFIALRRQE